MACAIGFFSLREVSLAGRWPMAIIRNMAEEAGGLVHSHSACVWNENQAGRIQAVRAIVVSAVAGPEWFGRCGCGCRTVVDGSRMNDASCGIRRVWTGGLSGAGVSILPVAQVAQSITRAAVGKCSAGCRLLRRDRGNRCRRSRGLRTARGACRARGRRFSAGGRWGLTRHHSR